MHEPVNPHVQDEVLYSRFMQRVGATLLDSLLLGPVALLIWLVPVEAFAAEFVRSTAVEVLWFAYVIYCHGRYGQTLGKRCHRLKVVDKSSAPITFRHAFLRSSVEIVFCVLSVCSVLYLLMHGGSELFASASGGQRESFLEDHAPFYNYLQALYAIWVFGSIFTIAFDPKRRALHDFVAGTVVRAVTQDPSQGRSGH